MLWLTPPIYEPGDADADMLAHVLGSGKSSRLYKKLVYDLQIAQDVDAERYPLKLGSVFYCRPPASLASLPKRWSGHQPGVDSLRKDGPTAAGSRDGAQLHPVGAVFRLQRMGGVANLLNQYNQFLGDPGKFQWDLQRYDAVNCRDHEAVRSRHAHRQFPRRTVCVKGKKTIDDPAKSKEPEKASNVASLNIPRQEWRKTAPAPGPLSKLNLPVPKKFTLSNGLTVLLTGTAQPSRRRGARRGARRQRRQSSRQAGAGRLHRAHVDRRHQERSALKFADDLAQIGAKLESDSDTDRSAVSTEVLKRNVNADFDLLSDVVLHPAFNDKEIERVRSQRATELLQINDDPQQLAHRVCRPRTLWRRVTAIWIWARMLPSRARPAPDLDKFWTTDFVPANSALVLAGDLTEAEARSLGEKYFGAWKNSGKRSPSAGPGNILRNPSIW